MTKNNLLNKVRASYNVELNEKKHDLVFIIILFKKKLHSCFCHQSAVKDKIHFHIKMVEWHLRRLYCLNFTYDSIIDAISASVINVVVAQHANYLPSNGLNGRRKKRTHNLCKQWKKN